jgi:hypothetical protein
MRIANEVDQILNVSDVNSTGSTGVLSSITTSDSAAIDAFARFRVSNPRGLFDYQNQYDEGPLLWYTVATGSGTAVHLPNESSTRIRIENPNESVIRQTKNYFRYQPGKSQLVLATFSFNTLSTGVTRKVGYFDGENGVYFEVAGTTAAFVLRSFVSGAVVEERITQSSWNIDKFDGSGVSGVTGDFSKAQIFASDYEWMGVGRVRVGFVVDGMVYYCHQFLNANNKDTVYMTTANLPIRYEISSDGTAAAENHDLTQICCSITSEGGVEVERGIPFSAGNGVDTIAVTTRRPVLSIRPKMTFNGGVTVRGLIDLVSLNVLTTAENAMIEAVYGGTLTGAGWADVDTNSFMEYDVSGSSITGGIIVDKIPIPGASQGNRFTPGSGEASIASNKLPLALDIDGNHPTTPYTDILTIVAESIPGTTTDVTSSLLWRELR